jgi:imidazolonepropionase-like amidohydrolase
MNTGFPKWISLRLTPDRSSIKHCRDELNEQFGRLFKAKLKEVKAFYDAGGRDLISLGTDHPSWGEFFSGFGSHRDLQALVLAGIHPAAAIKIGTINSARAINIGSISSERSSVDALRI